MDTNSDRRPPRLADPPRLGERCEPAVNARVPASTGPAQESPDAHRTLQDAVERQAVLAAGLAWLYHTTQPPGAIIQHGRSLAAAERIYTFHPAGQHGTPVVVLDVRHPRHEGRADDRMLTNPLTGTEPDEAAEALAALGVTVVAAGTAPRRPAASAWTATPTRVCAPRTTATAPGVRSTTRCSVVASVTGVRAAPGTATALRCWSRQPTRSADRQHPLW